MSEVTGNGESDKQTSRGQAAAWSPLQALPKTEPQNGEEGCPALEQESENLFEKVMKENFPNLAKEIDIQVQEAHTVPNKMYTKRPTPDTS